MHHALHIFVCCIVLACLGNVASAAKPRVDPESLAEVTKNVETVLSPTLVGELQGAQSNRPAVNIALTTPREQDGHGSESGNSLGNAAASGSASTADGNNRKQGDINFNNQVQPYHYERSYHYVYPPYSKEYSGNYYSPHFRPKNYDNAFNQPDLNGPYGPPPYDTNLNYNINSHNPGSVNSGFAGSSVANANSEVNTNSDVAASSGANSNSLGNANAVANSNAAANADAASGNFGNSNHDGNGAIENFEKNSHRRPLPPNAFANPELLEGPPRRDRFPSIDFERFRQKILTRQHPVDPGNYFAPNHPQSYYRNQSPGNNPPANYQEQPYFPGQSANYLGSFQKNYPQSNYNYQPSDNFNNLFNDNFRKAFKPLPNFGDFYPGYNNFQPQTPPLGPPPNVHFPPPPPPNDHYPSPPPPPPPPPPPTPSPPPNSSGTNSHNSDPPMPAPESSSNHEVKLFYPAMRDNFDYVFRPRGFRHFSITTRNYAM
ncbi:formin-like protein 7 [Cephus cinctus]|uniref:Formin-like protein 7 n=1 Tax=Cephus cinctus TaxID=211228 RepID=A0AAJ7C4N8_CEPCN|nr:formin-like protein 7 [Cephus cinctus]